VLLVVVVLVVVAPVTDAPPPLAVLASVIGVELERVVAGLAVGGSTGTDAG
jgi:hypothetical protein